MAVARKELSRIEKGTKEDVINEIKRFEFDGGILGDIELVFEDWEFAQTCGVYYGLSEEIELIEVKKCIPELKERISTEDPEDIVLEKRILYYLEQFDGFMISL
jgi:hypothetical protein